MITWINLILTPAIFNAIISNLRYTGFIHQHEHHGNEGYYKQVLTEKEDFILRETQCDQYYKSGQYLCYYRNK